MGSEPRLTDERLAEIERWASRFIAARPYATVANRNIRDLIAAARAALPDTPQDQT